MLEKYPLNVVTVDTEMGMGKRYSEEVGVNAEVIHMNFGNPFHHSTQLARDILDDNVCDSVVVTEKPKRVAIIGGPRNIASLLIHACEESGIEVTETSDRPRGQFYDESKLIGNPNMKTISPAMLLNKHHHDASPYAHGKKSSIEDLSETLRKDMRKAQNATNKANGFGKRLTKKDKLEMAKHKDGWHAPELTPHITIIDGKEVLSFRRKKNIQTYVSKFEHEVAIKVPTKELGFTTTAVDMEWKTTATVKDGKVTDVKVTDTKHTIDGECKDID